MFEVTDNERDGYASTGALSVDADGKEVLLGLTREETGFLMLHTRARWAKARRTLDDKKQAKELLFAH